jgi:hypothetical protein
MMRRTATCAGLALALFFSAWIPLDSKPAKVEQALSFEGIDVVVLQGNPSFVHFSGEATRAEYDPLEIPRLLERREGRVLVIFPERGGTASYDIHLPPTLRRLQFGDAHIVVQEGVRMSPLVVLIGNELNWRGDIGRLDIIDTRKRREEDCTYCGLGITIQGGSIGELRVSTAFGHVQIEDPDDIRATTLFLGPEAHFSLGMAKRQAQLQLRPWRAGIIDAPPQETAPQ